MQQSAPGFVLARCCLRKIIIETARLDDIRVDRQTLHLAFELKMRELRALARSFLLLLLCAIEIDENKQHEIDRR